MREARNGVAETFAAVARSLAEQADLEQTLKRIIDLAVETVPGAEQASISVVRRRREVETVAATAAVARDVDAVQYETAEGPCLDAIWEEEVVRIGDLSSTARWPAFSQRAADLGILSMLSFRLFVEEHVAGALNLYNGSEGAFDDEDVDLGHAFAAHAALAWEHSTTVDGLRTAAETRALIGQATGVLMHKHRMTADSAFQLLRRESQHRNVKLRDLAQQVVDTGTLSER